MIRFSGLKRKLSSIHQDERGMTIIELLAGLLIMTMISSILYAFLLMGVTMYKRVTTETQLRNQANLVFSQLVDGVRDGIYVQGVGTPLNIAPNGDRTYKSIRLIKRAAPGDEQTNYIDAYEVTFNSVATGNDSLLMPKKGSAAGMREIKMVGQNFKMAGSFVVNPNITDVFEVQIDFSGSPANRTTGTEDTALSVKRKIPLFRSE
ncbi:PulJ/GspJ family protein [Gorillibacterium sp. sgz5001074]|uniref:PulJ/GspJ family protein n=1 Tax=Gorillibacterium sp. sgz5001074 TaxID=3446695 RepID=UPI003F66C54B